jgi:phosphoribulokinase
MLEYDPNKSSLQAYDLWWGQGVKETAGCGYSKKRMHEFTAAMDWQDRPGQPCNWDTEPVLSEALVNIAKQAAGSRCCTVQDARNH